MVADSEATPIAEENPDKTMGKKVGKTNQNE